MSKSTIVDTNTSEYSIILVDTYTSVHNDSCIDQTFVKTMRKLWFGTANDSKYSVADKIRHAKS